MLNSILPDSDSSPYQGLAQGASDSSPKHQASHEPSMAIAPESSEKSGIESGVASMSKKLPYHPNHQVELLHLHAETEALLQHLYLVQRQRQLSDDASESALLSELRAHQQLQMATAGAQQ